jgi:hypothetical protein
MSHLLLYYQRPEPATWVFLSSFLLFGLFFVFHRFWCLRNLDLVLLVLLAPGLMMVYEGRKLRVASTEPLSSQSLVEGSLRASTKSSAKLQRMVAVYQVDDAPSTERRNETVNSSKLSLTSLPTGETPSATLENKPKISGEKLELYGFVCLLSACGLLLTRMLIDPAIVRRPLLEPNLNISGLSFLGISLLVFLLANVITSDPRIDNDQGPKLGPGYALLNMLPDLPTTPEASSGTWSASKPAADLWLPNLARIMAIFSNLAIVFGIIGVGYWHFDNVKTGIGAATCYLLLPYTAQMTGNVEHALPAAFLVLAILAYRLPLISGILLGAGAGLVYYPLFVLPLWGSFYWHRGVGRFLSGVAISLTALVILLLLGGVSAFLVHVQKMFGVWLPTMQGLEGVWSSGVPAFFRLPVLVGFIILSLCFVLWPARKTLGTLVCGTAAVMLAAQFWHGYGGGLYMAWFLPAVLLTIFRPNLDDRIAIKVVRPNWAHRSKPVPATEPNLPPEGLI